MHKPLPFAEYIRNQGFSYIHLSDCVTDRTSSGARTITREVSDTVRDLPHSAGPSRLRRAAPSRRFHAILSRLHSCAVRRGSATRDVAPVCVAVHFSAGSDDQDHDTLQILCVRVCKLSALHQCVSLTTGFRKGGRDPSTSTGCRPIDTEKSCSCSSAWVSVICCRRRDTLRSASFQSGSAKRTGPANSLCSS